MTQEKSLSNACREPLDKDLLGWTTSWLVTFAIASFGPITVWQQSWITAVAVGVNFVIGILMIFANKRALGRLDELQRKIQLDATAICCMVGIVGGLSYSLLDITGLIGFDAQISHVVLLMGATYIVSLIIGRRHYA